MSAVLWFCALFCWSIWCGAVGVFLGKSKGYDEGFVVGAQRGYLRGREQERADEATDPILRDRPVGKRWARPLNQEEAP